MAKQYARDNLSRARVERIVEQTVIQGPQRLTQLAKLCNCDPAYMCRFLRRLVAAKVLSQPKVGAYAFVWRTRFPEFEPALVRGVEMGNAIREDLITHVEVYKLPWFTTEPSIFQMGWTGSGICLGWIHAGGDQLEVVEWGKFQTFMGRIKRKDPQVETPHWSARLWRRVKFLFRI